jgi:hypothetical protein
MIKFDKVTSCKNGGKFVSVKYMNGEKIYITNKTQPVILNTTKFNSLCVYADKRSLDSEDVNTYENYLNIEKEIFKLACDKFSIAKSRPRAIEPQDYNDMIRLIVKTKTAYEGSICDLDMNEIDLESLKGRYELYAIIQLDSLYIHPNIGIVPQLKIRDGIIIKVPKNNIPMLNKQIIIRRYESVRIKELPYKDENDTKK